MTEYDCDEHGLPLDPAHPWNQPNSSRDPTAEWLQSLHRAFRQGVRLAVLEAMMVCQKRKQPVPAWVLDEGIEVIISALTETTKTAGKTGNWISKAREDLKHFVRWDTATEIRERQLMKVPGDDLGKSWGDCWAEASKALRGTFASGGPDAIKTSYNTVAREKTARFAYLHLTVRRLALDRRL
jgi:hypothetical protein